MKTDIYPTLVSRSLPLIKAYHNDLLVHDWHEISVNPGVPFLHFTRDCGTYLVTLHAADSNHFPAKGEIVSYLFGHANREKVLLGLRDIADYCTRPLNETTLCLHFDGRTLREVSHAKAMEIARTHVQDVLRIWKGYSH